MKLLLGCLDDFIAELKERNITEARVTPKVTAQSGGQLPLPLHTIKVLVTAKLNSDIAECCLRVGRDYEDFATRRIPEKLIEREQEILKQAKAQLENAGISAKPGLWTEDGIEIDGFLEPKDSSTPLTINGGVHVQP